jgi:hypothetical protein
MCCQCGWALGRWAREQRRWEDRIAVAVWLAGGVQVLLYLLLLYLLLLYLLLLYLLLLYLLLCSWSRCGWGSLGQAG